MRTPLLLLALSIGIGIIYYAGNFTPTATPRLHANPNVQPTTAATAPGTPLTPDQARQLTSKQRLEFIQKGLLIQGGETRVNYLCALIEALTKEELTEATDIINADHNSLDIFRSRIGETLSIQWGRLDPLGALPLARSPFSNFYLHAHEFMKSWFETDPAAALAWAQAPVIPLDETDLAAHGIALSAGEILI